MLYEYIGKDGAMGFRTGDIYNIIFEKWGSSFVVEASDGKLAVYSNEASAMKNWRKVNDK